MINAFELLFGSILLNGTVYFVGRLVLSLALGFSFSFGKTQLKELLCSITMVICCLGLFATLHGLQILEASDNWVIETSVIIGLSMAIMDIYYQWKGA